MVTRTFAVDELVLDDSFNLRDHLDPEAIERYTESIEDLPPVTVFEIEDQWVLVDGFHRHAASVAMGRASIDAVLHQGTFEDALLFASSANLKHGLPLRRQERRRAVEIRLRLQPESSDRSLSKELGVSRDLVARVRLDLVQAGQIDAVEGRVGADGKVYPSPPTRIPELERVPQEPGPDSTGGSRDTEPKRPGNRSRESGEGLQPTESPLASASGLPDAKQLAQAAPVEPGIPTIDEMLELMTRQLMEVACWMEEPGFGLGFQDASPQAQRRLRAVVGLLSDHLAKLESGDAIETSQHSSDI